MPVDIRVIRQAKVLGLTALGTAGHLAAFPVGTSVRELRDWDGRVMLRVAAKASAMSSGANCSRARS